MPDLKDALDKLETGQWCSIVFVSYDKKRGTAGEIVRIPRCRLAAAIKSADKPAVKSTPEIPNIRQTEAGAFTRKVKTANGNIREFHPRLLIAINGRKLV